MNLWTGAFLLGLFGSLHCLGMCGPIALSLPVHRYGLLKKYAGILLYNLGRISSYAFIGLIFGSIGTSFVFFGFQQYMSIAFGVILLLYILFSKTNIARRFSIARFDFLFASLKSKMRSLFQSKKWSSLFAIGLLNGLLPCGMVYMSLAGALATGSSFQGMIFMVLFGLGTVPMMFAVAQVGDLISLNFRSVVVKLIPYSLALMSALFILRGLNLGIPYLSPKWDKTEMVVNGCHDQKTTVNKNYTSCETPAHKNK